MGGARKTAAEMNKDDAEQGTFSPTATLIMSPFIRLSHPGVSVWVYEHAMNCAFPLV